MNTQFLKLINPNLDELLIIDKFSFEVRQDKLRVTEPLLCWSVSSDNIYVANEDRGYEIWVFDFNGKLIRKIQKEYKQIAVSENFKNKTLKQGLIRCAMIRDRFNLFSIRMSTLYL